MKTKITLTSLLLIFIFAQTVKAQPEDEEAPMFSKSYQKSSFAPGMGNSSRNTVIFEIKIENKSADIMTIKHVDIPEYVQVFIMQNEVPAYGETKVIIRIYKGKDGKSSYNKTIKIVSEYQLKNMVLKQEKSYTYKGKF